MVPSSVRRAETPPAPASFRPESAALRCQLRGFPKARAPVPSGCPVRRPARSLVVHDPQLIAHPELRPSLGRVGRPLPCSGPGGIRRRRSPRRCGLPAGRQLMLRSAGSGDTSSRLHRADAPKPRYDGNLADGSSPWSAPNGRALTRGRPLSLLARVITRF